MSNVVRDILTKAIFLGKTSQERQIMEHLCKIHSLPNWINPTQP